MSATRSRPSLLLIIALLMWIAILIYDIEENAHILMIIMDGAIIGIIVNLCFSSRGKVIKIKTVQEVEDEISEIESRQKTTEN